MTGKSPSRKATRSARRRDRYSARTVLWSESSLRRVRSCGLNAQGSTHAERPEVAAAKAGGRSQPAFSGQVKRDPVIGIKVTPTAVGGSQAGFSGVQSCGSTWACPVCSEKIQAHRHAEVARALEVARARGWVVGFHTFTVRHSRSQSLKAVWGAVSTAWRATVSGSRSAWENDRYEFGVVGYLRLVEVTHGTNGWHVHVHALVFLDPAAVPGGSLLPVEDVARLGRRMSARWAEALKGTSFRPSRKHGHDSRLVTSEAALGDYFAKNLYHRVKSVESTAHDVTSSHSKTSRHGNVTPFGILARLAGHAPLLDGEDGSQDAARWREWERVSKGKRQLLWSNGLRAELGLVPEQKTDEEVVEEDAGGVEVVTFTPQAYRRLARMGLCSRLLDAAENGRHALQLLLLEAGAQHEWGPPQVLTA